MQANCLTSAARPKRAQGRAQESPRDPESAAPTQAGQRTGARSSNPAATRLDPSPDFPQGWRNGRRPTESRSSPVNTAIPPPPRLGVRLGGRDLIDQVAQAVDGDLGNRHPEPM